MQAADLNTAWSEFLQRRIALEGKTANVNLSLEQAVQALDEWIELQKSTGSQNEMDFIVVAHLMNRLESVLKIP
jgi:hypothetical protein